MWLRSLSLSLSLSLPSQSAFLHRDEGGRGEICQPAVHSFRNVTQPDDRDRNGELVHWGEKSKKKDPPGGEEGEKERRQTPRMGKYNECARAKKILSLSLNLSLLRRREGERERGETTWLSSLSQL